MLDGQNHAAGADTATSCLTVNPHGWSRQFLHHNFRRKLRKQSLGAIAVVQDGEPESQIAQVIGRDWNVPRDVAVRDVREFIDSLVAQGVLAAG